MAKSVDAADLKSAIERCVGSSPTGGTKFNCLQIRGNSYNCIHNT